VISTEDFWK